jgi:hypothetical protein
MNSRIIIRTALLPLLILAMAALASAQGPMVLQSDVPQHKAHGGQYRSPFYGPHYGNPYHQKFSQKGNRHHGRKFNPFYVVNPCLPVYGYYPIYGSQGMIYGYNPSPEESFYGEAEPSGYSINQGRQEDSSPSRRVVTTGNVFIIRASKTLGGMFTLPDGETIAIPKGWEIVPAAEGSSDNHVSEEAEGSK